MRSPPSQDVAVSPVIGTILLVAMTVVFVALAAVVVMGLSNGMFDSKQVGLTLKPYATGGEDPAHGIGILVHGGADAGDLVSLSAVITGPKLIYAKTGNNTVPDPQVGPEYRMAAFVDPAIIELIKKGKYTVNATTAGTNPVEAMESYATVTGKFRDGTEQVLLVQKVLIPAIPGTEGSMSDEDGYISIVPYNIRETYPAHGFIVKILNKSIMNLDSVKFMTTSPGSRTFDLTSQKDPIEPNQSEYTYDISASGWSGWDQTPYPNVSYVSDKENFWVLGELTGNVSVTVMFKDGNSKEVKVGPITIPPRQNIFENKKYLNGKISYKDEIISLSVTKNLPDGQSISGDAKSLAYYFIGSGSPVEAAFGKTTESIILLKNSLENHKGQTIDAYVKVSIKAGSATTQVWYRVASVPVNTLLNS